MISLKKSLGQLELLEELQAAALGSYLSAIDSIERHAVRSGETLLARHRASLKALRKQVGSHPSRDDLKASRDFLDRELKEYSEGATLHYRRHEADLREILTLIAAAAESLRNHNQVHSGRFGEFAQELETLASVDDLREIRRRLARQVERLKQCVREMATESDAAISQLHQQIQHYQNRLKHVEELASTDPLTGIANRREGERRISERIHAGKSFCIVLLDLTRFKTVNDRLGHLGGDEVLRAFARRLTDAVRTCDTVCRWGGDEFLILLDSALGDAMARAQQIAAAVFGDYSVTAHGRRHRVRVHASLGLAEHRQGETPEQLFARADAILYDDKTVPQDA